MVGYQVILCFSTYSGKPMNRILSTNSWDKPVDNYVDSFPKRAFKMRFNELGKFPCLFTQRTDHHFILLIFIYNKTIISLSHCLFSDFPTFLALSQCQGLDSG